MVLTLVLTAGERGRRCQQRGGEQRRHGTVNPSLVRVEAPPTPEVNRQGVTAARTPRSIAATKPSRRMQGRAVGCWEGV